MALRSGSETLLDPRVSITGAPSTDRMRSTTDKTGSAPAEAIETLVEKIMGDILRGLKEKYKGKFVQPEELAFVLYGTSGSTEPYVPSNDFFIAINNLIKSGKIRYNKDRAIGLKTANVHKQGEIINIYQAWTTERNQRPKYRRGH